MHNEDASRPWGIPGGMFRFLGRCRLPIVSWYAVAVSGAIPHQRGALPFLGAHCFSRGRHNGVCLLHWRGLHLETEEPKEEMQVLGKILSEKGCFHIQWENSPSWGAVNLGSSG